MAVVVTNSGISDYDEEITVTANAATADVADTAEAFTITPTKSGNHVVIMFTNAAANGAYTYSIPVGALWAGDTLTAFTGSIAQGTTEAIQLASGKHLSADGTYVITLTPASGKKLLTDHAATMQVIETV